MVEILVNRREHDAYQREVFLPFSKTSRTLTVEEDPLFREDLIARFNLWGAAIRALRATFGHIGFDLLFGKKHDASRQRSLISD